jgi:hypothetical protein
MASFNDFVQQELPKRPFTEIDGSEGQVLVRRGPGPRQVAFETIPVGSGTTLQKWVTTMTAGVLTYDLPALPSGEIMVYINGVQVSSSISGVVMTITSYTAGMIDSDDELVVYY